VPGALRTFGAPGKDRDFEAENGPAFPMAGPARVGRGPDGGGETTTNRGLFGCDNGGVGVPAGEPESERHRSAAPGEVAPHPGGEGHA